MIKLTEEEKRIRHRDVERRRRERKGDEINALSREKYKTDPGYRAKKKAVATRWFKENPENVLAQAKRYREKNKDKIWAKAHTEEAIENKKQRMRKDYSRNRQLRKEESSERYNANREKITRNRRLKGYNTKTECVEYKGGKCVVCGAIGHQSMMTFHHRDPSKKEFSISSKLANGWTLERLKPELDKCDLACASCHNYITWLIKNIDLIELGLVEQ